jgi:hypothetical protein
MVPGVTGDYHDDAIYVITAKALAQGEGYRLINLPDAPRQTKYPILYPLMLAAVWKVQPEFPENVALMQRLTLATSAITIGLAYLYLVRFGYCGRLAACCIGLLCATSPEITYFSTVTMAEMPFALLTIVALWRLERALADHPTRVQAFLTGAVLVMPMLCRTLGAAFVVGGLAHLAARRRRVGCIALGSLVTVAPWVVWASGAWGEFGQEASTGYYTDYVGAWATIIGGELARVVSLNAGLLFAATPMSALFGAAQVFEDAGVSLVPPLFILGLATWTAVAHGVLRGQLLAWCLVAYAFTLVVWPWPPGRFLIPLYPALAAYLWKALGAVLMVARRIFSGRAAKVMAGVLCVIAVAANITTIASQTAISHETHYPIRRPPERPFQWQSFELLFAWLRHVPAPTAVIAGGLDTMLFLYTGHPSVRPFPHRPDALFYGASRPPTGTAQELATFLRSRGVRYLVDTPMYLFAEEKPFAAVVGTLRRSHPGLLTEVYRGRDERFVVYQVNP